MSESESTSSSTENQNSNDGQQGRQVAKRAFAAEINDSTHVFKQSDEERAPNFALLPSGEIANRYFMVGTVTEVNDVGNDDEYWQARVVDPTGTVFVYAGQYQPQAAAFLSSLEPPAYIAVTAKPSTFESEGETYISLRPETITHVDNDTRDRWVAETIERTEARLDVYEQGDSEFGAMAGEHYDADPDTYREAVNEAREDLGMDVIPVASDDSTADSDDMDDEHVEEDEGEDDERTAEEAEIAAAVANADIEE